MGSRRLSPDGNTAALEARNFCELIVAALEAASDQAKLIGEQTMLDHLNAAKSAAVRGRQLLQQIAELTKEAQCVRDGRMSCRRLNAQHD